jgi:hypothetical protein
MWGEGNMDKTVLGFLADVLYIKGMLCYDEYETIQDVRDERELGVVVERMLRGEFNGYKKGETYGYKQG